MTDTKQMIIIALVLNGGEVQGTEELATDVLGMSNVHWVRIKLNEMQEEKIINVIRGNGRGHKNIIRLNRNSPGYRRKH